MFGWGAFFFFFRSCCLASQDNFLMRRKNWKTETLKGRMGKDKIILVCSHSCFPCLHQIMQTYGCMQPKNASIYLVVSTFKTCFSYYWKRLIFNHFWREYKIENHHKSQSIAANHKKSGAIMLCKKFMRSIVKYISLVPSPTYIAWKTSHIIRTPCEPCIFLVRCSIYGLVCFPHVFRVICFASISTKHSLAFCLTFSLTLNNPVFAAPALDFGPSGEHPSVMMI